MEINKILYTCFLNDEHYADICNNAECNICLNNNISFKLDIKESQGTGDKYIHNCNINMCYDCLLKMNESTDRNNLIIKCPLCKKIISVYDFFSVCISANRFINFVYNMEYVFDSYDFDKLFILTESE